MPKKSWIWQHASLTIDGLVKCNICDALLCYGGSTSTMHKHLKKVHKMCETARLLNEDEGEGFDETSNEGLSPESTQSAGNKRTRTSPPPSSSSPHPSLNCPLKRKEAITKALAKMIAVCQLPLSFCHSNGFLEFMKVVEPAFNVPYPQAIKARLGLVYNEVREKIAQRLESIQFVSLTTDEWSSIANESYLSTTIHFVDCNWTLCNHALDTVAIDDRPSAENIAIMLEMEQEDWGISNKVLSIVHDNASAMKAAVRLLNKKSINCAAHTLQLSVQDALKNVDEYLVIERQASKIVAHFKHSNVATMALTHKQEQLGMNTEKLVQSCPTRWDSIYFMCDVLHRNRSAVCATLSDRGCTNSHIALNLEISEQGWRTMYILIKLLKPLHVATKFVCSDTKVTFSAIRPLIKSLVQNHYAVKSEDDNPAVNFKTIIVSSLKKRFKLEDDVSMCEMQEILPEQKAAFLDPRYKDLEFESSVVASKIRAEIKALLSDISTTEHVENNDETEDKDLDFLFSTESKQSDSISQYERYLAEPQISNKLDPLVWWSSRERSFPAVASLAKRYLAIPASSASSERLFSTAGNIVTAKRSCLVPDSINLLVFLNKNKNLL